MAAAAPAALTIIGETLARKGLVFEYRGETDPGCAPCRLRRLCHAVEPGRSYRISEVRPVKHDVCHVYDGKVQVVEATPLPLEMNVPVAVLKGTMVTRHFEDCGVPCPWKAQCAPLAVPEGRRAAILKVGPKVDCRVGRELRRVQVDKVAG